MRKITTVFILLSCGIFLGVGTATAALATILPGSETPLLGGGNILDTLYGMGNLQRVDDDTGQEQIWFPANGRATAKAKYAGKTQDFGYIADKGAAGFDDDSFVSLFTVSGGIYSMGLSGPSAVLDEGNVPFLWALKPSEAPLWTSLPSQNDDGLDHMVTWKVVDTPHTWVIAWEDLPADAGKFDADYNDLVLEVTVSPVPIPPAILLLGSGLVAMIGVRRRFRS